MTSSVSTSLALVVDDSMDNREIFRIVLEAAGYTVSCASNGEEALARLGTQKFRLMILDLAMPVMNGRDMMQILSAHPEQRPENIIVATANYHMATEIVEEMADYVLVKPVMIKELVTLAKRLNPAYPPA